MTINPEGKDIIVVFSEDKELIEKVKQTFPENKIIVSHVMLETFEIFKNHSVKAVVFETYQTDPFCGVNETDLDILMYYGCSEDSLHKSTTFIPIDKKPQDDEDHNLNFANDYYGRLYDKYLYLKPGTFFDEIDPESIEMPEGMQLLGNLVNVLSDATKDLDEKITIAGGTSQVGEETQRIQGSPEEQDKTVQVVSGSEAEKEAVQVVSGSEEEDEAVQIVSGGEAEKEAVQVVSGGEAEKEAVQVVSGSEEEDVHVQVVPGSESEVDDELAVLSSLEETLEDSEQTFETDSEEEGVLSFSGGEDEEDAHVISGGKADKDQAITVSGYEEEEEEDIVISGEAKDLADKTVRTIKGERQDLGEDDFMKVKSLHQEEEEEVKSSDINGRNSKGQTPIMLFAKKGDTEKVRSLLNSGAKHDLMCKKGLSLLHYACMGSDDVDFIDELILKYGLRHTKRDSKNRDCLYYAVIGNNSNVVEYLLNNGARIATKYEGVPLLHVAAKTNAAKSFNSLLLFEPNLKATDDSGEDIIKYCKSKKKLVFLKMIAAVSKLKQKAAS